MVTAQCALRHDGHSLMSCVIDYRQAPDAASFCCAVNHEVHRPHLVGLCWSLQGMSIRRRYLLAPAFLHLQASLGTQAIHTFVIDQFTCLTQLQIDHSGALAAMPLCQSNDLLLERTVAVLCWIVPKALALMPMTPKERLSLSPWLTKWRTSSRQAGELTTFFARLTSIPCSPASPLPAAAWGLTRSCRQICYARGNSSASEKPCRLHNSATARPASASRRKPMICSSVNRFLKSNLLFHGIRLHAYVLLNTYRKVATLGTLRMSSKATWHDRQLPSSQCFP